MKRLIVFASVVALVMGPLGSSTASAEPRGVTCSLSGKAKFSEGLTDEAQKVNYTFTGTLSDCRSSDDSLESGKVEATGSGELSCGSGSSRGTAEISWNNGKTTVVEFSTTDIAALVDVQTEVTKSTEPAAAKGDSGRGLLVFQADPEECSTKAGVKTASFDGGVGSGGS